MGPFARIMDLGERKNPSSTSPSQNLNQYVEDFDEPRTKLAERRVSARRGWAGEKGGFFSILPMTVHPPIVSTTRNRALPLIMRS